MKICLLPTVLFRLLQTDHYTHKQVRKVPSSPGQDLRMRSQSIQLRGQDLRIGGQALAEILFALAIAILLINGLVVAMRSGISNAQFSQHKVQSVHLAQEAIEQARFYRDNHAWDDFVDSNKTSFGDTAGVVIPNTIFTRTVVVTPITVITGRPNDGRVVTVTVSWDEFNKPVQTTLSTIFTNWR